MLKQWGLSIRTVRAIRLVIPLALGGVDAQAQPVRQIETGFERDVNRYGWVMGGQFVQRIGRWQVNVQDRFTSDAYLLFSDQLSLRDENQLDWRAARPVTSTLTASAFGTGAWFGQSSVFYHYAYSALRYQPSDAFWIEPAAGFAWDGRPGVAIAGADLPVRTDAGPAYGFRLGFAPPTIQDYALSLEADGNWQRIRPRQGRHVRVMGSVERMFEAVRLRAEVGLATIRRDSYQAVSFLNRGVPTDRLAETVEATTSDTLLAALSLDAPLGGGLRLTSRMDFATTHRYVRTLRAASEALFFDTDFDRQMLGAEGTLRFDRPGLTALVGVRTAAEVERRLLANRDGLPANLAAQKFNLLQQADFDRGLFALTARVRKDLGRFAALGFDGTASILRHDTPDVNADDRDELFHTAEGNLLLRLSRYIELDLRLLGTYYHTVFIRAERSAENNVQRSLRLRPGLRWNPSKQTAVRVGSEVRATYTVDDFVMEGRRPRDQSARELRYEASVAHDFGSGVRLVAVGSLSDLHLGRLLWDQFAEIPFDTLRTYSGWVRLQAGRRIVSEVGLRFFIRSDFDRAVLVRYPRMDANGNVVHDEAGTVVTSTISRPGRRWIDQVGPTCAITWPMRQGSALRLNGWLNLQRVHSRLYGDLPEASAAPIRAAARRGTLRVLPNVTMSAVWNF